MAARKKGSKPTKSGRKKRNGTAAKQKTSGQRRRPAGEETAAPISLKTFMIRLADAHSLDPAPKGACLVTDPNTGSARCTLATREFCKNTLKGTFIGGPCGG